MSWRTVFRGHDEDLAFLDRLRAAALEELLQMMRDHMHKDAPQWKRAAIVRALERACGGT